jgi:hypothetical protein
VRQALRLTAMASTKSAREAVEEFWLPVSGRRADLVVLGRYMDGFEIKTERDTLRRLPAQAAAYEQLFDRCSAVVAARHLAPVEALLPDWWGLSTISVNGEVSFTSHRRPRVNGRVDPELLVRLLWKEEALAALRGITGEAPPKMSRTAVWASLLDNSSPTQIRRLVRQALIRRDPTKARIPTRRFAFAPADR